MKGTGGKVLKYKFGHFHILAPAGYEWIYKNTFFEQRLIMNIKSNILVLGCCLFIGLFIISIGCGAAFPQITFVASPIICPNGTMTYSSSHETVSSVQSIEHNSLYCVSNSTGEKKELMVFPLAFYTTLIYGFLLYFIFLIINISVMKMPNHLVIKKFLIKFDIINKISPQKNP